MQEMQVLLQKLHGDFGLIRGKCEIIVNILQKYKIVLAFWHILWYNVQR